MLPLLTKEDEKRLSEERSKFLGGRALDSLKNPLPIEGTKKESFSVLNLMGWPSTRRESER